MELITLKLGNFHYRSVVKLTRNNHIYSRMAKKDLCTLKIENEVIEMKMLYV